MRVWILLVAAVAACAPTALAGEIATIFVGNGRIDPGGAAYFDVTVADYPLEIIGFDQNSNADAGARFSFEVFTMLGTHVGNETNAGLWTSRATGVGTGNGFGDSRDEVVLNNYFTLEANTTYGMAVVLADTSQNRTNGDGQNQHYANADVALDLGSTSNVAFQPSIFEPRVWNGAIYYNVIPEPAAVVLLGCLVIMRPRWR